MNFPGPGSPKREILVLEWEYAGMGVLRPSLQVLRPGPGGWEHLAGAPGGRRAGRRPTCLPGSQWTAAGGPGAGRRGWHPLQLETEGTHRCWCERLLRGGWCPHSGLGPERERHPHPGPPGGRGEGRGEGAARLCLQVRAEVTSGVGGRARARAARGTKAAPSLPQSPRLAGGGQEG